VAVEPVIEREGPCRFCGRQLRQYKHPESEARVWLGHEQPWCEEFTLLVVQRGKGAATDPESEGSPS
jgi:hypothetical protein